MFHKTTFSFLSVFLVCLWAVVAGADSNSQGWSGAPDSKEAFEAEWKNKMNTPLPNRLLCMGKSLYSLQPVLDEINKCSYFAL